MIDDENQTLFAQDEPLMETVSAVHDETPVDPAVAKKKKRNKTLATIGISIFILMFVSLLAVALTLPEQIQQVVEEPSPTPTAQQTQESELDKTLNLLREDIIKADPSTSDLPVPPIDFTLTLEEN